MPVEVLDFLNYHKLIGDPFATTNAEEERSRLSHYFVRIGQFRQLVGDPLNPTNAIVFGGRGSGKTSHRLEVARHVRHSRTVPALPVHFTAFDLLLSQLMQQVTLEQHANIICQATLEALHHELGPDRIKELLSQQSLDWWMTLFHMHDPVNALLYGSPVNGALLEALKKKPRSIETRLSEVYQIVRELGFTSVYFLVDRVGQAPRANQNIAEASLKVLQPLFETMAIVQGNGFAFKLFLPDELERLMQAQWGDLLDRVSIFRISWVDSDLAQVLSQRLSSYSERNDNNWAGVSSFRNLMQHGLDVDPMLIRAAEGSPRQLLEIARTIIYDHCDKTDDIQALIEFETVRAVLTARHPNREWTAPVMVGQPIHQSIPPQAKTEPAKSGTGPPLLRFDTNGDLWLGNQILNVKLSKLLYRCMEFLWNNRGRVVPYRELQDALYSNEPFAIEKRGDPHSSCDKLVRRLRGIIEPGKSKSHIYIDLQPGIGYVLRNFRED